LRKPNLFIVGAPRCGTTSLWSYLKDHPDIFMSAEKELYFFDSDLRPSTWQPPSLEQYLANFSAAGLQKIIGEATPSYLRSERAPTEIKVFSSEAQIVVMLRNPVDVMYSLHSSALYSREPLTDFEAAVEADAKRKCPEVIGYRDFTDFPRQVQRYFDLFGRANVHTIIFDDLKADPAAVYRNTIRFLGVDAGFKPKFTVVNANANARNPRLQRNLVHPSGVLRHTVRALVPQRLRSRIQRSLLNSNLVVRPRAPMDPRLRRRLQKEFEPQVEQLSRLIGRDLSGWCVESNGDGAHNE
jgi:Sulfotransferase domain